MTGYNTILKIRLIEDECAKMGLRLGNPKYGWSRDYGDVLSVMPADDALPIYTRDAELFTGTLEDLDVWLRGAKWMYTYLSMLKVITDNKIKKKEDDVRHEQLARKLKGLDKEEEDNVPF